MKPKLILASASPRRNKILKELGLEFEVVVPDADEVHWLDDPIGTVRENSRRKCALVHEQYAGCTVIAADTVVVFDGRCIGKPECFQEATAMLREFSGKAQVVYTGLAIYRPQNEMEICVDKSEVFFKEISDKTIDEYFGLVNPLDKAGGYDIDQHGDLIISRHTGSWTNIMGLPKEIIREWLCK